MCLVVVAFRVHDRLPLVVAANRDEFHARPAAEAHWWQDADGILAGRDLQAGGTWLGVHRRGRFAAVTNYRDADQPVTELESRGRLVADFLLADTNPLDYAGSIDGDRFAGFNLLLGDSNTMAYLSNRGGGLLELPPGIYGLSNATLDTPWEKVNRSKRRLGQLVDAGQLDETALLQLLADTERGPASEVREERLPFDTAHAITAPFIVTSEYGTRCSTVVRAGHDGHWTFIERRFDAAGTATGNSRFSFGGAEDLE